MGTVPPVGFRHYPPRRKRQQERLKAPRLGPHYPQASGCLLPILAVVLLAVLARAIA